MKTLCVIQHTEAEYLGLIEDHLESRNIRFAYKRPFTEGGTLPTSPDGFDGLVLLGGGPYGVVSGDLLPSLSHELRLTRAFLAAGLPVIGLELGAVLLAVAAGGGAAEAPLRFAVTEAVARAPGLLEGHLPDRFPLGCYLRDAPVLPAAAEVLAADADGTPLLFSIGNSLGCLGHPGMKRGMIEDLIMEFVDTPDDTAETLAALGRAQGEIAEALSRLMVGLVAHARLM
ncbi:MAG: hypothetical protein GC146_17050 [Limimaricola sp.]|uniref:hypothetical protein n=1 Tax=Limimaricola sp. TaxID=2211665 RepID=UPI001DEB3367|nr:hypothetical protein [Limimaricola sp.]MBI1418921.1 hypothetical protein [Limimaricola sp.]